MNDRQFCERISRWLFAAMRIVAVMIVMSGVVSAEDRVVIQSPTSASRVTLTGRVLDYTGRELTLQTGATGGTKRYPRADVVEVTTPYLEPHERGLKLLADGRPKEAAAAFETALDDEGRSWVRRSLLARQVECAWWTGDYTQAARRFLPIAESDPETWHYQLIPLVWTDEQPATASIVEARAWLRSPQPAARLIGASWLLTNADRLAAEKTLSDLASEPNRSTQLLARFQLWRLRLEAGPLPLLELRRWEAAADSAPRELRPGLLFLIGRGYAQRQEALSAAAAWLRLPFEFPEIRTLAAEAQQRAAEQLLIAGDKVAARTLANEVGARFRDLPVATRAVRLLEESRE